MKPKPMTVSSRSILWGPILLFGFLTFSTAPVRAQTQGYNAVYNSLGACCSSSAAFVDASAYTTGTSQDFCVVLYNILSASSYGTTFPSGAVIDARGINAGNNSMSCGSTSTPWVQGSASTFNPSTILLPSGTLTISKGWVLPDRTRIFGEGNNPSPGGTTIKAHSGFAGTMIQMGSSSCNDGGAGQCYGVVVASMLLEGSGQTLNGIVNTNSGGASYVDHVNLHQIEGTGLQVSGSFAQDSGPYSNIACSAENACSPNTTCVQIGDSSSEPSSTRGVHGLTCTAGCTGSSQALAAVTLDSSGNTIEDVHIEGFADGVLVGSRAAAQGNVLLSVNGSDGAYSMTNVIHICGSHVPAGLSGCTNPFFLVSDLSIAGATSEHVSNKNGFSIAHTIQDDVTSTLLPHNVTPKTSMAQYALGEGTLIGGGYSRFATSPLSSNVPTPVPTWAAAALGAGMSPSTPCAAGAMFSNTTGGPGFTFWVCTGTSWKKIK